MFGFLAEEKRNSLVRNSFENLYKEFSTFLRLLDFLKISSLVVGIPHFSFSLFWRRFLTCWCLLICTYNWGQKKRRGEWLFVVHDCNIGNLEFAPVKLLRFYLFFVSLLTELFLSPFNSGFAWRITVISMKMLCHPIIELGKMILIYLPNSLNFKIANAF